LLTRQHFATVDALLASVSQISCPHLSEVRTARLVLECVAVAVGLELGDEGLTFEQVSGDELLGAVSQKFGG
jgi:hypothetical protein